MINIKNYNLGNYVIPKEVLGGICVDIGSNVGSFFEKNVNNFSLIHFYEPYEPCFQICLEKSNSYSNIRGFNQCVLDTCRENIELVHHFNFDSGSNAVKGDTINNDWDVNDVISTCSSVDLETVLRRVGGKIDYLKCDCETSEYHVFNNKNLKNINYISLELHWQMGRGKYYEVLNHILLTHNLLYPNENRHVGYVDDSNVELFFVNKMYD